MSRTYKDLSYDRKRARLNIKDTEESCPICLADEKAKVIVKDVAIFYSHEVKELEALLARAADVNIETKVTEVYGRLATLNVDTKRIGRDSFSKVSKGYDRSRLVFTPDSPDGNYELLSYGREISFKALSLIDNILNAKVPFKELVNETKSVYRKPISFSHVYRKENLFTIVTLEKTIEVSHWHFHYGRYGGDYRLNTRCRCAYCLEPRINTPQKDRAQFTKVKNTFNTSPFQDFDEALDIV